MKPNLTREGRLWLTSAPRTVKAGLLLVGLILGLVLGLATTAQAGIYVPDALAEPSLVSFELGVSLDRSLVTLPQQGLFDDQLVGLSLTTRLWILGIYTDIGLSPSTLDQMEETRGVAETGLRGFFRLGKTELSVGAGLHLEARLNDHFWLLQADLVELGFLVYDRGSWRVRVYGGLRHNLDGRIISSYLVDPNGFQNEIAEERLQARKSGGFEGFLSLVFARRL